jgi:FMN phosphatase YigB (HAD superfamily)
MDGELSLKAVLAGTKAMVLNDGNALNKDRFWAEFAKVMNIDGEMLKAVEESSDHFYLNEFNKAKAVMKPSKISKRLVQMMNSKGYNIVLATNPLFPPSGVETRLAWAELSPQDFLLITHYANSTYCKPNLKYYQEILDKIDKKPEQCLMIGNNVHEDMCAGELGIKTYLVTDFMENEHSLEIDSFHRGSLDELEIYLQSFPAVV